MSEDPKKARKKKRRKHSASIIQREEDGRRCYVCMLRDNDYREHAALDRHHVMFGAGRREKAEADGLVVMVCRYHHEEAHRSAEARRNLCRIAQEAWERMNRQRYGKEVHDKWMERYGRNYREE